MRRLWFALVLLPWIAGCGSNSSAPEADFTLSAGPATVAVANNGPTVALGVVATAVNGFTGQVQVAISGLPTGVVASPSTLTLTPGQVSQVLLTATNAALASSTVTLTATSGTLSHSSTATVMVVAGVTTASLSATSYDFGGTLVGSALTQAVVTITNTGSSALTLSPALAGDTSYSLVAGQSCGATLAGGASCVETVSYAPTAASAGQAATLSLGLGNVATGTSQSVALSGMSAVLAAGTVTATNNPQVALYSLTLPFPGSMTVNFGQDTSYGRSTWTQSTTTAGGTINMLVAGMLATTQYHMQASVQLANGVTATDADHTFTTKAALISPTVTATTTAGMTPQPGVEELTFITGSTIGIGVTDLGGNLLWSYALPAGGGSVNQIQGVKLLPNGNFLITICQTQGALSGINTAAGVVNALREIDLAGNIVREITAADLSAELQAAGYDLNLIQFNHDISQLPNGHWIVLANILKPFTNLSGYPNQTINVAADVVIDLDENLEPVWVWNEFDHFDINRRPMLFPDWTHTNAVVYSPDDGQLIVSVRHQNWVVKVDYANGSGAGDILWKLGEGGDFTLAGGVDPTDWQYAQHYPSLFSTNSSGTFKLGMMDNGDDRMFPTGVTCGTAGAPVCLYTTIPVFQIDESAKTATLLFHQILPPSLYSFFGGNTELLDNGNIEYDLAGLSNLSSHIFEVTPTATPETVWQLQSTGTQMYRGYRIPSLYPGVQW